MSIQEITRQNELIKALEARVTELERKLAQFVPIQPAARPGPKAQR